MMNKVEGKYGDFQYSTHTINISLSLFLKSKRVYDDIRASELL